MKNKWENSFLKMALLVSEHSTCIRKKVGAVLVKDNRVISMGYNGVLPNEEHCEDKFKDYEDNHDFYTLHNKFSRSNEVHAEQNCIAYAAKHGIGTNGATLYVTTSPCNDCAKLIVASGIKKVVYLEFYDREPEGVDLLSKKGIEHNKGEIL